MRRTFLLLIAGAFGALLASGLALVVVEEPARAAFPGQNGDIAFFSYGPYGSQGGLPYGIYRTDSDGSGGPERLAETSGYMPEYSPDGTKIAFTREFGREEGSFLFDWRIYTMNADGSGGAELTDHHAQNIYPSWFPSGDRIAFQSTRDGNTDIYAQGLDPGTGAPVGRPVRLTRDAASDGQPAVSPDGKTIAFKSTRGGGPSQIYAMRAAPEGPDNRPRPLTDGPRAKGDPDWSPDGRQIAFARYEHGPQGTTQRIWKMRADGSGETRLTAASAYYTRPAWSPDGRYIAFQGYRDPYKPSTVWKMRPVPQGPDNVPVMVADGGGSSLTSPTWQPLP